VKKFHLHGGETQNMGQGMQSFLFEEIFIGNTEKTSCKLTTKGV